MTTSSLVEICEHVSFDEGKMYKYDDMVVLCVCTSLAECSSFEGVVIHPGSKNTYCIGRYVNCFNKRYFTNFHGEVVLKS